MPSWFTGLMFVNALAFLNASNSTQTPAASKVEAGRSNAMYGVSPSSTPPSAQDPQGLAKEEEVMSQVPPGPGDKRKEFSDDDDGDIEAAIEFLAREAAEKVAATEIPTQSLDEAEVVAMGKQFVLFSPSQQHRIVSCSPHFNTSAPADDNTSAPADAWLQQLRVVAAATQLEVAAATLPAGCTPTQSI